MTIPSYTIPELLKMGSLWQKNEHGCEVSFFDSVESQTQQVSNEELTRLDSRLVHVLSNWYRVLSLSKEVPLIHSDGIECALAFWNHAVMFTDKLGEEIALADIEDIDVVEHGGKTEVWVYGEAYNLDRAGELVYAKGKSERMVSVELNSMEQQYPGWQKRKEIADSLDAGDLLYDTFVFSKEQQPTLPDSPLPDSLA